MGEVFKRTKNIDDTFDGFCPVKVFAEEKYTERGQKTVSLNVFGWKCLYIYFKVKKKGGTQKTICLTVFILNLPSIKF